MSRLDKQKQIDLEPKRIEFAIEQIKNKGYDVENKGGVLEFEYKGQTVKVYPYSGWCTGKTIKDTRGIKNLIKQLK